MSLGIHYNVLDFDYIPTDNNYSINILDKSLYIDTPEKPLLQVLVPGMSTYVAVPYNPKELTILNSHVLGLTLHSGNFTVLPDGVYEIIQMICPYDKLFNKKCIFRDNLLKEKLYSYLANTDITDCNNATLKKQICDVVLFLEAAKANALNCNVSRASEMYKKAEKIIDSLKSC